MVLQRKFGVYMIILIGWIYQHHIHKNFKYHYFGPPLKVFLLLHLLLLLILSLFNALVIIPSLPLNFDLVTRFWGIFHIFLLGSFDSKKILSNMKWIEGRTAFFLRFLTFPFTWRFCYCTLTSHHLDYTMGIISKIWLIVHIVNATEHL